MLWFLGIWTSRNRGSLDQDYSSLGRMVGSPVDGNVWRSMANEEVSGTDEGFKKLAAPLWMRV